MTTNRLASPSVHVYLKPGHHFKLNRQKLWRYALHVETDGFHQYVECTIPPTTPMGKTRRCRLTYDVRFDSLTLKV